MFRCFLALCVCAIVSAFGPASLLRSVRPAAGLSEFRDVFTPA
jgi:hypothetical protein